MATTPTPGPSEPQGDAAGTRTDTTSEHSGDPEQADAAENAAPEQADAAENAVPEHHTPASTGAEPPKATPADLMAAAKPGPGAPKPSELPAASRPPKPEASKAEPSTPATAGAETGADTAHDEWGRVDANGDVYLRTAEGERHIGSWQVGEPEKALAFYRRKFDDLVTSVDLIEQRLTSGAASPDSAEQAIAKARKSLAEPHAIGDIDTLRSRLEKLGEQVSERRAERKAARAEELDEARGRKERIAGEAERIAEGDDWRHGADKLRKLLDEWKSLPRLDRTTDDALWRRFSTARTHYTRRRKAHFAEQADRRERAREIKEEILAEAEELADSVDWSGTSRRYRELMSRWKAAGPAPRAVDEALWKRFRAAQDTFFEARSATFAARDAEQQENLRAKEALLAEAEELLPVKDWKAARGALRAIQERWESIGHVPRDSMKSVEGRLRKVEDAIRTAEQSDWQRTSPEARARAEDTVTQLRASISDLEAQSAKARESGNERKVTEAEEAIAARRAWLEQAERALDDFR